MATFGVFNVNCQLTLKSKESSKRRRLDREEELEHWKALAMQQQASIALLLSQRKHLQHHRCQSWPALCREHLIQHQ